MGTFLSYRDLSQRWGVSTKTLERWVRRRLIPAPLRLGPGQTARFAPDQIDAVERAARAAAEGTK